MLARMLQRALALVVALCASGCSGDDAGTASNAGGAGGTGGADAGTDATNDVSTDAAMDAPSDGSTGGAADAGMEAGAEAAADAAPFDCSFDAPQPPTGGVSWAAPLTGTGASTLGGHGHDDGKGPVGFCPGVPLGGQPFYRLIAAGFETDEDLNNDGDQNDPLPVDFWKNTASFVGVGESGGRVNIYVEIVDASGKALNVDSNPEIKVDLETLGAGTQSLPLTSKPVSEFQTNFPMTGGGTRFGVSIQGASDRVVNMRLPVNHHVCYVLVFRRET